MSDRDQAANGAGPFADVEVAEAALPRRDPHPSSEGQEERGFSAAGGTADDRESALRNLEVDVVEDLTLLA